MSRRSMELQNLPRSGERPNIVPSLAVTFVMFLSTALTACQTGDAQRGAPSAEAHGADAATPAPGTPAPPKPAEAVSSPAQRPAPSPASEPAGSTGATSVAALCAKSCEHAEGLRCPAQSACREGCVGSFSAPVCQSQLGAMLRCTAQEPPSSWECGPSGVPALRDGSCDKEQAAVIQCLTSK